MDFAVLNGVAIHYRAELGKKGAPVIAFSNSLGTDFRIWSEVAARLSADFNLVFYDKRGHGLSDTGNTPYSIEDHAKDLAALLGHLKITQAVICGLSVGGLIAQSLYKLRPDLIGGLILCDTAAKIGNDELWNARIKAVTENGIASIAGPILERWFTPAFRNPGNAAFAIYRNMLVRSPAEGYAATCAALRDGDFTPDAARIRVPVLCVVGEADGSTPPPLVEATARLIKGARFEVIPGAAHLPCIEQPKALAKLIREFVNGLGGAQ